MNERLVRAGLLSLLASLTCSMIYRLPRLRRAPPVDSTSSQAPPNQHPLTRPVRPAQHQ